MNDELPESLRDPFKVIARGERWLREGIPVSKRMERMRLPAPCLRCKEIVQRRDQHHYYSNRPEPVHHACFMRPIIGSVKHLKRECSCFVKGADETDDPSLTPRQAAEAALALWESLPKEYFDELIDEDDQAQAQ